MTRINSPISPLLFITALVLLYACEEQAAPDPKEKDIVEKVEVIDIRKAKNIEQ